MSCRANSLSEDAGGSRPRCGRGECREHRPAPEAESRMPHATGAKEQPAGKCRGSGTTPGSKPCAAVGRPAGAAKPAGPACRDAADDRKGKSAGACSTMRPAYITPTRSQVSAMTPRSWLISTSAIFISRRICRSRSRICAWIVTSSAVVGSSATSSFRVARPSHRDHHALVLAAGKLMRITIQAAGRHRKAHKFEQSQRFSADRHAG